MTYTTAGKIGDEWGIGLDCPFPFGPIDATAAAAAATWGAAVTPVDERRPKREDASAADKGRRTEPPQGIPIAAAAAAGDWRGVPRAATSVERVVDIALFALAVGLVVAYAVVIIIASLL